MKNDPTLVACARAFLAFIIFCAVFPRPRTRYIRMGEALLAVKAPLSSSDIRCRSASSVKGILFAHKLLSLLEVQHSTDCKYWPQFRNMTDCLHWQKLWRKTVPLVVLHACMFRWTMTAAEAVAVARSRSRSEPDRDFWKTSSSEMAWTSCISSSSWFSSCRSPLEYLPWSPVPENDAPLELEPRTSFSTHLVSWLQRSGHEGQS